MDQRNAPKPPKFTRGEKCIYIHLILTFVLIITSVIVYFAHMCLVRHPGDSYLDTRRSALLRPGGHDLAAADYLPVGVLYAAAGPGRGACGTVLVRPMWSLAPAHCVLAISDPGAAPWLPHWRLMYRTAELRYVAFNISTSNYNYMEPGHSNLGISEWDQAVIANKGASIGPYILHKVDFMDRAKCNSLVAPVLDLRSYEYCVTLQQESEVHILHGAALLQDYDFKGLFTWGEREGKTLPYVILNITHFKDWLLDIIILKSMNV